MIRHSLMVATVANDEKRCRSAVAVAARVAVHLVINYCSFTMTRWTATPRGKRVFLVPLIRRNFLPILGSELVRNEFTEQCNLQSSPPVLGCVIRIRCAGTDEQGTRVLDRHRFIQKMTVGYAYA